MDTDTVVASLEDRLRAVATPERAENEKAYLKSDLVLVGATVPATRKVTWPSAPSIPTSPTTSWWRWWTPAGAGRPRAPHGRGRATRRPPRPLGPDDADWLVGMVREANTWALVDALAAPVVGALVDRPRCDGPGGPGRARDFWVRRRPAVAPDRSAAGRGRLRRFGELADPMLEEREFFIRKAIGWVLRDTARRRPALVVAWLEPRVDRAAGLTVREAVKHLPGWIASACWTPSPPGRADHPPDRRADHGSRGTRFHAIPCISRSQPDWSSSPGQHHVDQRAEGEPHGSPDPVAATTARGAASGAVRVTMSHLLIEQADRSIDRQLRWARRARGRGPVDPVSAASGPLPSAPPETVRHRTARRTIAP